MINDKITTLILKSFLYNEEYARKCLPYVQEEYFDNQDEKYLLKTIKDFIETYNNLPTKEALLIKAKSDSSLSQKVYDSIEKYLNDLSETKGHTLDWLVQETEHFCQEKALHNAILESVQILGNKNKTLTKNAIPDLVKDALSVSFDPNIGHDYIDDAPERYDFYHSHEERVPFDLDNFNKITNGGVPKKTLNIILAGTNVGKSLAMCHMAAANIRQGYNVLYITLELAEKRIGERIDANLMNVPLNDLKSIPKVQYDKKIDEFKKKILGKLKIKEYPTATASSAHFRALLNELKLKSNFIPDVIYIDYLNLCVSARLKNANNINSYSYIKSIAEELRGIAVESNVPIFSATQTTRSGYTNSDPGLEDTAESFGLPATADFMIALTTNENLAKMNKIGVKQLKNRYNDVSQSKRFHIGVDRSKMKLYNLDEDDDPSDDGNNNNGTTSNDTPGFDKGKFGKAMKAERRDFGDWRF